MKKQSVKERKLLYQATHKYLCPQCEGKTPKQLMLENMFDIPFLVQTKCVTCGYEGMLIEIPIKQKVKQ
jgi:Zn ribbon nucleic-acid-binding protein